MLMTAEGLSTGYDSHVVAENIDFTVEQGDYLFIVGENGSGKTTLMRTILGLQDPMAGSITWDEEIKKTGIGYLPQKTAVQKDFPATVREIVMSGCQGRCGMRPFYAKEDRELAARNMERLGVTSLAGKSFRNLSGGQQQRVLLARALCAAGSIILLDEPAAGLDPGITADMYGLIEGLNAEGMSVIMISHDIHAAMKYAKHILHMGDTVFFGTADEYRESREGMRFLYGEKGVHENDR